MKKSFLTCEKPLVTAMIKHKSTADECIEEIKRAHFVGAEAIGIQMEELSREYHTSEYIKRIFSAAADKPLYVTNYKLNFNLDLSYEELTEELIFYAENGATLCDITGDTFDKHPDELSESETAIEKQMKVIEKLHNIGSEVLMSSHINRFISEERVLEVAREHKRRGADISKIVTAGNTMAEQIENLRITNCLKEKAGIPCLFLSGGTECRIHRRLGILIGSCMSLCVSDNAPLNPQPYVSDQLNIRDNMNFEGK